MASKKATEETTAMTPPPETTAIASFDYGDDAGKGFENQTKADMSIPFINLLQALSPLVATEKAKPGQWVNTVTEQIWDREKGFLFVAGGTRRAYTEWVPRNNPDGTPVQNQGGGGYRGEHAVESKIVADAIKQSKKFGKFYTPDGNILSDTFYVYGAICGEDGTAQSMAVIPFTATKIKPYRTWMTRLRQLTLQDQYGKTILDGDRKPLHPPLYAHLTRITSAQTQNSNKQMYYVPVITSGDQRGLIQSLLPPTDERFQLAKECKLLFESGNAKVDYSKQGGGDDDGDDEGKAPF